MQNGTAISEKEPFECNIRVNFEKQSSHTLVNPALIGFSPILHYLYKLRCYTYHGLVRDVGVGMNWRPLHRCPAKVDIGRHSRSHRLTKHESTLPHKSSQHNLITHGTYHTILYTQWVRVPAQIFCN